MQYKLILKSKKDNSMTLGKNHIDCSVLPKAGETIFKNVGPYQLPLTVIEVRGSEAEPIIIAYQYAKAIMNQHYWTMDKA